MPQDAFTLRRNASELDEALKGGRINRINQPGKEELSLIIYTGKRTVKLVLNVNASDSGVYFSETEQDNPLVAPNFCMLLRKHLQGAEILQISQVGFERILEIRLRCTSDFSSCERSLFCEIMGKYSNVILTENGVILGALKTAALDSDCKRMIFPGAKYALPAPQADKVDPRDIGALAAALKGEEGNARFLFLRVAGLAPCTAEKIASEYRGGDYAAFVQNFIFSHPVAPRLILRDGKPVDFTAYETEGGIVCDSLSQAQCRFYALKRAEKDLGALTRKLSSAVSSVVKKHEKRLAQIAERRRDCADAEENRLKGELITANLYALSRGMKSCELDNYYDGSKLKIALDLTLTPAQNAQQFYKKYRKQKRTLEILDPQEAEVRAELGYAESLQALISSANGMEDLKCVEEELLVAGFLKEQGKARKKKETATFRTYEKDGFRILAGRNNLQNDKLLKSGAPDDIWLHVQKYHSCHVLIKTEGRAVPDDVLLFAAGVCAQYSDGTGDKLPVDYCPLKHVKKPPKAKAGFVTYSEYKTVLVPPRPETTP